MKRQLLLVGFLVLGVLATPASAQAASPDTTQLSSWRPISTSGVVDGGDQTVTVINTSGGAIDGVIFPLDEAPCDCTVTSLRSTHGQATSELWHIGTLAPGETATLDVTYARTSGSPLAGTSGMPVSSLWVVGLLFAAAGLRLVLMRRPLHLAV